MPGILVFRRGSFQTFKHPCLGSLTMKNMSWILLQYDMIHVTPPMGPPDCLLGSPISDQNGFVDVEKTTMRHKRYSNIFAIGDCANSPNGKTAAAVAGQTGVIKANLFALIDGCPMPAQVKFAV